MKLRTVFINLAILFISTYTPLFLYSIFWTFRTNTLKLTSTNITKLQKNQSKIKKIEAINNGLLPFYHPVISKKFGLEYSTYPIGSLPYTNSYYCNEGYELIKYKTDRFGLRNDDKKWDQFNKQSNIFILGDSFAHGACVDEESTIPNHISKKTGINTINLASGGNSPYEYMAVMKSILEPALKESLKNNWAVIVFFYNDNVSHKISSQKLLSKTTSIIEVDEDGNLSPNYYYKKKIKELIFANFSTDKISLIEETEKKEGWQSSVLYSNITLLPIAKKINSLRKDFVKRNDFSNPTKDSVKLFSKICTNKCKPIIAYIPYSSFWDPTPEEVDLAYKNQLINLALKFNITFIDGSKVIDRNDLHDYAPKGGHLSSIGYQKIGNLISTEIKK